MADSQSIYANILPNASDAVTWGYYGQNPEAGYTAYLNANNMGGATTMGNYARAQYGRYYNDYQGQAPYMPADHATFLDYLGNNNIKPQVDYYSQGARDRGESPFLAAPRTRFMAPT